MQRKKIALWALCVVAMAMVAGCGPKLTDQEKTLGPPPSAKNVRGGYVPPPPGASTAAPPMATGR